jgi:type II secretory pathway component PulJ
MRRTRSHSRRTSAPDEAGFTIFEVVVSVALVSLVLVILTGGLISVQNSEATVRGRATSLDELHQTLAYVGRDVRQAWSVSPASTASRIELQTFDRGEPATVVWEVTASGDLQRSVNGGSPALSQEGVLDPDVFSYDPAPGTAEVVYIDLTLQPKALPQTELTVVGEVRLRNRGGA